MTDVDATIADLNDKIRALELDRDYWRGQHDLVMQDWRADIEVWSTARADLTANQTASRRHRRPGREGLPQRRVRQGVSRQG